MSKIGQITQKVLILCGLLDHDPITGMSSPTSVIHDLNFYWYICMGYNEKTKHLSNLSTCMCTCQLA